MAAEMTGIAGANMTESEWTRFLLGDVKKPGGYLKTLLKDEVRDGEWLIITPMVAGPRSRSGIADRHIAYRSRTDGILWAGWVELKNVETTVKPLQNKFLLGQNRCIPGSAWIWRKRTWLDKRGVHLMLPDGGTLGETVDSFPDPLSCLRFMVGYRGLRIY